jgi:hypothetical protein
VVQTPRQLVVTEWKAYRINFLKIPEAKGQIYSNYPKLADILRGYDLSKILELEWKVGEWYHHGTIRSFVEGIESNQLKKYILGPDIQAKLEKEHLELRAFLVILVGSRHILLWSMDSKGILSSEPSLVRLPNIK